MDEVLEALYGEGKRRGGLGNSSPRINRWLGDIRKFFPTSVVQMLQKDALDRLDLRQMLKQPELLRAVQPDVHLVAKLLSLRSVLPPESRETARAVVRTVVDQLEKKLAEPMRQQFGKVRWQSEQHCIVNARTATASGVNGYLPIAERLIERHVSAEVLRDLSRLMVLPRPAAAHSVFQGASLMEQAGPLLRRLHGLIERLLCLLI